MSHLNHNSAKLLTPKEEIEETAKEMGGGTKASDDSSRGEVHASDTKKAK